MLNTKNRLRKKKDIELVFKKGGSFYSDLIGLRYLKNNLSSNRFCVIISAKISKKASIRNLLKRRIKAILIKEYPRMQNGIDLVIIPNKDLISMSYQDLSDHLVDLLKKIKIINV